jgi:hypothetical protein
MKIMLVGLVAASLIGGAMGVAQAQDTTTVVHKDDPSADKSKTVIKKDDGSKTVIKKHGNHTKKVHTSPDGQKMVVKKTTE